MELSLMEMLLEMWTKKNRPLNTWKTNAEDEKFFFQVHKFGNLQKILRSLKFLMERKNLRNL